MAARDKTPPIPSVPDLSPSLGKMDPKVMEYFTQQILLLREKALLQASVREEKKLLVENAKLKQDISELKTQLTEKQRKKTAKALFAPVPAASVAHSATTPSIAPSGRPFGTAALRLRGRREKTEKKSSPDSLCLPEADPQVNVSRLDIRVGRIMNVRKHPLAETLYIQEVELGESAPRNVVSKLGLNIDLEPLGYSLALFLCNIRPSKIKGVTSRARLLCCSASDAHIELLAPPPGAVPGDRVTCRAYPGEADRQLLPKERVWDRLQADLRIDAGGVATYKGAGFEVKGKGQCKAPTARDGVIKST